MTNNLQSLPKSPQMIKWTMRRDIGVPIAQGLDVPNFLKDIPNFLKDVTNFLKDVPNLL